MDECDNNIRRMLKIYINNNVRTYNILIFENVQEISALATGS